MEVLEGEVCECVVAYCELLHVFEDRCVGGNRGWLEEESWKSSFAACVCGV